MESLHNKNNEAQPTPTATAGGSIRDRVIEQIRKGNVAMKPRWHFVLRTVFGVLGSVIVALTAIYVVSFTTFVLTMTGVLEAPIFGFPGIMLFLGSFPWLLIMCALGTIFVLEILVRKYSFAYRTPVLYSLFAIGVFVGLSTYVIGYFDFHGKIFDYAERRGLPIIDPLYRSQANGPSRGIHPGMIAGLKQDGFILTNRKGDMLYVIVASTTRIDPSLSLIQGARVLVLGSRDGDVVRAIGVKAFNPRDMRFPNKIIPTDKIPRN